jgi:hypothetical protein
MRHTKYPELKKQLKELAKEIKEQKWFRDHYHEVGNDQSEFMWQAFIKAREFRHKHIAYCMLRGTPYEKIENYCNESPDWRLIEKIRGEHEIQTICACA